MFIFLNWRLLPLGFLSCQALRLLYGVDFRKSKVLWRGCGAEIEGTSQVAMVGGS
jgi:hypothetical protein